MQFSLADIKLIVGLGNIGQQYLHTRHNTGFLFADYLSQNLQLPLWTENKKMKALLCEWGFPTHKIILAKPTTMMNLSGNAVQAIAHFYQILAEQILIVHDDLDIELGGYKFQFNKGPKVHNGISSVEKKLGTAKFWRLRVGIEAREVKGNKGIPGMTYALQKFWPAELEALERTFSEIAQELVAPVLQQPID